MQDNNYNPYTNPSGGVPVPPQPPVYSAVPFEGMEPPAGYPQKSRLAAGILGILGGTLGLHNFYLGNSQRRAHLRHQHGRHDDLGHRRGRTDPRAQDQCRRKRHQAERLSTAKGESNHDGF